MDGRCAWPRATMRAAPARFYFRESRFYFRAFYFFEGRARRFLAVDPTAKADPNRRGRAAPICALRRGARVRARAA